MRESLPSISSSLSLSAPNVQTFKCCVFLREVVMRGNSGASFPGSEFQKQPGMMMLLAALACGLWIQTALRTFLWRSFSAFNANAGLGFLLVDSFMSVHDKLNIKK
jgi:hypothetical protein